MIFSLLTQLGIPNELVWFVIYSLKEEKELDDYVMVEYNILPGNYNIWHEQRILPCQQLSHHMK